MSLVGLELENGGVLLKFVETSAENGGARHVQEARYPARSPLPPYHRHPKQDERFTILEGALRFRVDGVERDVRAGDAIDVPKGAFHNARNPHDTPALVTWETRPALRTAEFFATMGRAMKGRTRPRLVDAMAILREYRDEFQLAKPPLLVQQILMTCLAPFGRRALTPSG
ncbi:MAG: cupin domain-containing protein [Deltaproteobacteria bacterium]|nr:cupin domain-containing protein [Deltaproteobacteria bacterium]